MTSASDLTIAFDYLIETDADFATALSVIQPLPDRSKPPGFKTLTEIIIEQQVSLASAAAIWKRMTAAISPFTPETLLKFSETELRELGLSQQKAKYCRALATDILEKRLILSDFSELEDSAVIEQLMQVKGIGRWTAEIYMMACLGHTDIWPAGDVALQSAMGHLKGYDIRPTIEQMDTLAEPLRPYRTIAARILWRYYADVVQAEKRKRT
jgi:DNA-3-methyladenine glycosylase II